MGLLFVSLCRPIPSRVQLPSYLIVSRCPTTCLNPLTQTETLPTQSCLAGSSSSRSGNTQFTMYKAPETAFAGQATSARNRVPILFLKTKSTPTDAYEDLFNAQPLVGSHFDPDFVPVLRHSFKDEGMDRVGEVLRKKEVHNKPGAPYGGMIFTSQRAVEAFAALVERGKGNVHPDNRLPPPVSTELTYGLSHR